VLNWRVAGIIISHARMCHGRHFSIADKRGC
jgi:hypothetical protein